jgi:hypothetical protein
MQKVISVDAKLLTAFRPEMINYELPTLARNNFFFTRLTSPRANDVQNALTLSLDRYLEKGEAHDRCDHGARAQ